MNPSGLLFLVGYPVAVAGIVRLRRTFRERHAGWFLVEEAGTAAIVAGWLLAEKGARGRRAAAVNAAWGLGLAAAWVIAGRRRRRRRRGTR
ncbi:MAG: hypothetical protein KY458_03790 [Actinobacteria bacterium]|nr:hypothetical protein [Actinomycetota bacterium]